MPSATQRDTAAPSQRWAPFPGCGNSRLPSSHLPSLQGLVPMPAALTISRSGPSGACHHPPGSSLVDGCSKWVPIRGGTPARTRRCLPGAHCPRALRDCALLAPIAQPALIWPVSGCRQPWSRGSRKPAWGAPSGPDPRMLPAALDAGDLPVSVTQSSAWENSMWPPAGGAPTPSRPTPPLPSWQGDWGKAASRKSTQRLWSCPELSAINPGASDFCFASEGGVGTPGSFCLLHSAGLQC